MKLKGSSEQIIYPCRIVDDFLVSVRYNDVREQRRLVRQHTTRELNPDTRQMEDRLDAPKWLHSYLRALIPSWSGCTVAVLQKLVQLHADEELDLPDPNGSDEIPCDHDRIAYVDPQDPTIKLTLPEFLWDRVPRSMFADRIGKAHMHLLEIKADEDKERRRSLSPTGESEAGRADTAELQGV